ncbi:MAG: glutathione S-transferase family protein [Gammaproteobacteria bacterium]
MRLYEYPKSRSTRVQWLLAELELDYESVTVDLPAGEQFSDGFLSVNPYGKVPVLVDDGIVITESAAICTWLAEKYAGGRLIPDSGSIQRGYYYQWIFFCMAELEPVLWSMRKHMLIYPKQKRSRAAIDLAREEYLSNVRCLDSHIGKVGYILDTGFSAADIIVGYNLLWADSLKLLRDFPGLSGYLGRLTERPSFPRNLFD